MRGRMAHTHSLAKLSCPDSRARRPARPGPHAALVEANLRLVRGLAGRLIRCGIARHVEIDELISVGTEAMLESAARFDPTSGARFTTFAFPRVRGAMIDAVAQLSPLPRGIMRGARRREASGEAGQTPQVSSLDAMRGEPAAEASDPSDAIFARQMSPRVRAALARLPARKRCFIEGHYFGERDLQSIGRELGMSKSWASRLHGQALADLRAALGE